MLVLCEEKSLVLCRTRMGRSRGSQEKPGHLAGAWSGPALSRRATSGASGGDSPMSGTSGIFTRNGSCSRHEYRVHPRFISQAMRPTPGAPESSAASAAASAGRRSDTRCSLFSPSPAWLGPIARNLSASYDDPESSSCPKPGSALSRPAGVTSRGVARSRALLFVSSIA